MSITQIPITAAGYERLKDELKHLKTVERPKVISEIADARALGDLSENAEYHAAREKQGFIEGRINELEDKIGRLQVINTDDYTFNKVIFGAYVTLLDVSEDAPLDGATKTYRIVGELESDIKKNEISITSPLAKALINKKVGDFVSIQLPKGEKDYEIKEISNKAP